MHIVDVGWTVDAKRHVNVVLRKAVKPIVVDQNPICCDRQYKVTASSAGDRPTLFGNLVEILDAP
jgi:hypothetical protein